MVEMAGSVFASLQRVEQLVDHQGIDGIAKVGAIERQRVTPASDTARIER